MPTVPYIDQTASPAPQYSAPAVTPMRNFAPQQEEALGAATQQAGEMAYKTGATIGDRLAEQVDDARVKAAEANALSQAQTINHDPQSGFLNQRGQSAIDQYEPAKAAVSKAFQDQLENLDNPIQKHMFQQVQQQHLLSIGQQMATHAFQETSQYSGEAAVSRANTFATTASNASASYGQTDADGNPTGDFAKNMATAEQETLHAVQIMKGAPEDSDVAKEALLNLHTQVATAALMQMMDNRTPYSKVMSVYEDMKDKGMLNLRSMDSLGKMVKLYSEQESTRTVVNQNLSDAYRASQGQPTSTTGTPDYQFPIKGATITAQSYDPESGGVNVPIAKGSNIQAPADGKVLQVGKDADGNFSMQIQHGDGSVTTFAGLNAANVKVGDQVQRGESVATSGTMEGSTAPSVMWSLADKDGIAVDPTRAGMAPVDLTKITDEKVLSSALNSMRAQVTDPYLQQQATSEMESIVRHNQQMQNAAQTQLYKQAEDAFYANKMQWRSVPPSLFNQLTPEQQQGLKDKQTEHVMQQMNQSEFFKTHAETDLLLNFYANPQMITTDNVEAALPNLSRATSLALMQKAQENQRNPQNVIEAQGVNERINYYASHAGINIHPGAFSTKDEKQTMIDLHARVQQDIDQIKAQNNGKATADQVDKAIQQELIRRTVVTPRSPWNPLAILGNPTSTKTLPLGATQIVRGSDGKDHYLDRNNQDLGVVP